MESAEVKYIVSEQTTTGRGILRRNIAVKAGPYFAYGVDGKFKVGDQEIDLYKDTGAKRFDVGADVGVDFEYHRFVFGAEYEIGFSNMSSGDNTIKNMAFYLTVGYKF